MLLIGLTIGAIANILLFRAVAGAPNPSLPVAIANVASVEVFFVAYFKEFVTKAVNFSIIFIKKFTGMICT